MGQDAGCREVAGVVEQLGGVGPIAVTQLQIHGLVQPDERLVEGRPHHVAQRQGGEGPAGRRSAAGVTSVPMPSPGMTAMFSVATVTSPSA